MAKILFVVRTPFAVHTNAGVFEAGSEVSLEQSEIEGHYAKLEPSPNDPASAAALAAIYNRIHFAQEAAS